jgi:hypothetical protein
MECAVHPKSQEKTRDGLVFCGVCGIELRKADVKRVMRVETDAEQLERAPTNAAVFRGNAGSTSKNKKDVAKKRGFDFEPSHVNAVKAVLSSPTFTKECPECKAENVLHLLGPTVFCVGCGASLGEHVLRWLPGCTDPNVRTMADLRQLGKLDGPEDHPMVKRAREIFSELALSQLSEEDAHRVAGPFIKAVKGLCRTSDSEITSMLNATCLAMKVPLNMTKLE